MAKNRKVDALAGTGSFADRLRRRRKAIEDGDLEGARAAFAGETGEELTEEEFDQLPERVKQRMRGD